ncbi:hypothetical protein EDD21DRAFT_425829 [Dissophora ornata]|nr:hypothetical protein EDD21DRAFT_425829 [Dissophora ornata]
MAAWLCILLLNHVILNRWLIFNASLIFDLFGTPLAIAHTVIHKFVGHLEKQATELIWKPRCKTTVGREKERGITARDNKAKYTGPRGEWSDGYGYICEDGYCPCGGRRVWKTMKAGSVQDPHLTHMTWTARCYRACWERGTWERWRGWGGLGFGRCLQIFNTLTRGGNYVGPLG